MTERNKTMASSTQSVQTLTIVKEEGKSEIRQLTEIQLSPLINNALTLQVLSASNSNKIDFTEAVEVMKEKSEKIIAGDLSELEATLAAQVITLDTIYNTLILRSAHSMGNSLKITETYMRLALKTQAQCVRTVEVLAAMKNPPIVIAKQANIAQGHQQINNGNQYPTHAGKTKNPSNELLSEDNNAPLDSRGTIEASGIDKELATVETIDWSKDTNR
ncbi:hypothetical protein [Nitrosomonas oligotropha]|uniref:hypothetical protein n=1 Tax=Nitrosomonas oligotropha TaxID=42354 RepID=UPI00136ACA60|nr:hypothetical protein [Nitrosomonas oligotropha]